MYLLEQIFLQCVTVIVIFVSGTPKDEAGYGCNENKFANNAKRSDFRFHFHSRDICPSSSGIYQRESRKPEPLRFTIPPKVSELLPRL